MENTAKDQILSAKGLVNWWFDLNEKQAVVNRQPSQRIDIKKGLGVERAFDRTLLRAKYDFILTMILEGIEKILSSK